MAFNEIVVRMTVVSDLVSNSQFFSQFQDTICSTNSGVVPIWTGIHIAAMTSLEIHSDVQYRPGPLLAAPSKTKNKKRQLSGGIALLIQDISAHGHVPVRSSSHP